MSALLGVLVLAIVAGLAATALAGAATDRAPIGNRAGQTLGWLAIGGLSVAAAGWQSARRLCMGRQARTRAR